ncbi:MAG: YihY/virulence factor BrkB family protein [Chloroflexales bacterium]|nr:YihY/virulence factor BrkB family protein [Chloroflexales bacterium]
MSERHVAQRLRQVIGRLQATLLAFRNDRAQIFSAALVYYGALSVVPLLVMIMAVPGLLLRFSDAPRAVTGDILQFAEAAFGPEFRALLERSLADLQRDSLIATLVALGAMLFGASLVFRHISRCFRYIWQATDDQAATVGDAVRKSMLAKLIDRFVGFIMVLALSAVLVVSTLVAAIIPLLQRILSFVPLISDLAGWAVGPVTSLSLSMGCFLLLFKYLPPRPMRWRDVWLGALLSTLGWELAKQVLVVYILVIGTRSSYAALSVLMAVLFWFYANGSILFFCAELCKVTALEHQGQTPPP